MPLRTILVVLILADLVPSPAPVAAQVINGESIYEDNFVHTPPRQDSTNESHGDTTKTHRQVEDASAKRERK